MAKKEEQVSAFLDAMTSYAKEKSEGIHKEVEAYKATRLREEEEKALTESTRTVNREHDKLQKEISCELSRRDMAARRELLSRRSAITDRVFSEAEQRLRDYTAGSAYVTFLADSLREMSAVLPAEGTVYSLARQDEAKLAALQPLCPSGSTLTLADDIRLGGIRGFNEAAGMIADDTLDSKLDAQHEWFLETSGLTVE